MGSYWPALPETVAVFRRLRMLRVRSTRRVLASDPARGIEWEEIRLLTERYTPEALREPVSTLNAAILRITASLDVDTVLREVVDTPPSVPRRALRAVTWIGGVADVLSASSSTPRCEARSLPSRAIRCPGRP